MTGPPRYFELIRQMHNRFDYRLRLVRTARQQGIQAAARLFQTTVPTVRQWLRRYQQKGLSGLQEQSRAPHHCPHKTARPIERQVWAPRRQLPTCGAARLQREFDLAVSHTAIQRHLDRYGVDRRHLVWQTDNGSEFLGGHDSLGHRTGFPASLGDSQHPRILPAAHTYQSDVETVHRLIEDEFFAKTTIDSALLQLGASQLPQGQSQPPADYRATRSSLPARSLLASSHQLGLLSQYQRGSTIYLSIPRPWSRNLCLFLAVQRIE